MADITYTPDFDFVPFIDNQDTVKASGEKGFNNLFLSLQDELKKIAKTVQEINDGFAAIAENTNASIQQAVDALQEQINGMQRLRVEKFEEDITIEADKLVARKIDQYDPAVLKENKLERLHFVLVQSDDPKANIVIEQNILYLMNEDGERDVRVRLTNISNQPMTIDLLALSLTMPVQTQFDLSSLTTRFPTGGGVKVKI